MHEKDTVVDQSVPELLLAVPEEDDLVARVATDVPGLTVSVEISLLALQSHWNTLHSTLDTSLQFR